MIFIEPTHIFLDETIWDHNDPLAFELQSLPGVSKVAISVVTLFFLASEVCAKLLRHIPWENVRRVEECIMEVKHTQIPFFLWQQYQPLLHGKASFASDDQRDCPCLYQVL
jgi:hypothetical protein